MPGPLILFFCNGNETFSKLAECKHILTGLTYDKWIIYFWPLLREVHWLLFSLIKSLMLILPFQTFLLHHELGFLESIILHALRFLNLLPFMYILFSSLLFESFCFYFSSYFSKISTLRWVQIKRFFSNNFSK